MASTSRCLSGYCPACCWPGPLSWRLQFVWWLRECWLCTCCTVCPIRLHATLFPAWPMDRSMQCHCYGHRLLHACCKLGPACCWIGQSLWRLPLVWCAHAPASCGSSMCRCHFACRAAFWPSMVGIRDFDASLAGLNLFLSVANNTTLFAKVMRRYVACLCCYVAMFH